MVPSSYDQMGLDEDSEREANQTALELLIQRNSAQNSDEEVSLNIPDLPVTVLTPVDRRAGSNNGHVSRTELDAILEIGPQQVLSALEFVPVIEDSRFKGYQLSRVINSSSPMAQCGLIQGDIITAVNGRSISRVEDFFSLWTALEEADHVNVDMVRNGLPHALSWTIY